MYKPGSLLELENLLQTEFSGKNVRVKDSRGQTRVYVWRDATLNHSFVPSSAIVRGRGAASAITYLKGLPELEVRFVFPSVAVHS